MKDEEENEENERDDMKKKKRHHTVNSRKSGTLFINYHFRWLMVAEIYWK